MGTLGERIAAAREMRGWTRKRLAQEAGVSPALVTVYEADERRNPSADHLGRIALALEVTVDWLLHGTPAPPIDDRAARRQRLMDALEVEQLAGEDRQLLLDLIETYLDKRRPPALQGPRPLPEPSRHVAEQSEPYSA